MAKEKSVFITPGCVVGGPDAFLPDGTPLYFKCDRGGGKCTTQLELYNALINLPTNHEHPKLQRAVLEKFGVYCGDSPDTGDAI